MNEFVDEHWKKLDHKAIVSMCDGIDDIKDFTLMRLLILTMKFMVECESSLNTNIKCVDYQPIAHNNKNITKQILLNEMKMNGIYQKYLSMQKNILNVYKSKRNQSMGKKTKLTKYEIACIMLWTCGDICNKIKPSHRKGNSCKYRYFCQQIMFGLKKLKKYDSKFGTILAPVRFVYSGICNVKIDVNNYRTEMKQFIETHCNSTSKMVTNNKCEYCMVFDTFTSTTTDFKTALAFSVIPNVTNGGIILEIEKTDLIMNDEILCGDISWISQFDEKEILLSPCMIDIWKLDDKNWCDQYKQYIKRNNYKAGDKAASIVLGAQIKSLGNVSLLMKKLTDQVSKGY